MPRRNARTRRSNPRPPKPEPDFTPRSFDAMARDLVSRGLASESILVLPKFRPEHHQAIVARIEMRRAMSNPQPKEPSR